MEKQSRNVMKAGIAFISCFCMISFAYAQDVAFKISGKKLPLENGNELKSQELLLTDVLRALEKDHNISFAYQKQHLAGKVAGHDNGMVNDIDAYLTIILLPHGLTFKKVDTDERTIYMILPEKEQEGIRHDSIQQLNNHDLQTPAAPRVTIAGRVTGLAGSGMPGVNIVLQGTTEGVVTDVDGNYSIGIPESDESVLVFSYVGFLTQRVRFSGQQGIDVVLEENKQQLSEVIVTALGLSRDQKTLGYAVSTVSANEITASGNTNFASALYGKAPGVRIRTAPGGATSAVTVQVRGFNSLHYNTQPLYVIDGVLMRDGNEKGASGINNTDYFVDQRIRGNGILDINPFDIETITILKGASATALYGSDAASGVVVITTKKGIDKQGLGVDLTYSYNIERVAFTPHFQNVYGPGYDRQTNMSLGADEQGWVGVDTNGDGEPDAKRPLFESNAQFGPAMQGQQVLWWDGTMRKYTSHPDNYKDLYRTGFSSMFNAAVSKRSDRGSFRFSYTRNDYKGTQVGGRLERNTASLNGSLKLLNKLRADVVLHYTNSYVHNRPLKINRIVGSWSGFFSRAEDMSLFFEKYKTSEDYKWVPYDQALRNPGEALRFTTPRGYEVMDFLWKQLRNNEDEFQNRLISSTTLHYDILKNLSFRGRVGGDLTGLNIETKEYNEYPVTFNGNSSTGSYKQSDGRYTIFYTDALLTYDHKASADVGFSVSGGFQMRDEHYRDHTLETVNGLATENLFSLQNSYSGTTKSTVVRSNILKYAFLGLANVSFRDYLFLEATGRQEYSSTLPPSNNRYFYPSMNAGFIFSDVVRLPKAVNYGKLRVSAGLVGNAPPAYEANTLYTVTALKTSNGQAISASASGNVYGNNEIKPERTREIELGLETRLLRNKIGVDLTYYTRHIGDQIIRLDVPASAGADKVLMNAGELHNKGCELALNTTVSGVITWNASASAAVSTTKVNRLATGIDRLVFRDLEGSAIRVTAEAGQSVGNIYVYPRKTDEAGNFIISDNGLYVIDKTRYVKAGNMLPKVIGGVSNTLTFRNFTLDLVMDYSLGGKVISPPLKYGTGSGMYEGTLKYRDAAHGGLPYYINTEGEKVLLPGNDAPSPDGSAVYHDGVVLQGVTEEGSPNTKVIDAATYYINTFDWGNNAWNEAGALYDNSYIKLREAVIGYNLPKALAQRLYFKYMRISLTGRNLFYFWRTLKDLDPESAIGTNWVSQGIDEGSSAATRSYGFSINLGF